MTFRALRRNQVASTPLEAKTRYTSLGSRLHCHTGTPAGGSLECTAEDYGADTWRRIGVSGCVAGTRGEKRWANSPFIVGHEKISTHISPSGSAKKHTPKHLMFRRGCAPRFLRKQRVGLPHPGCGKVHDAPVIWERASQLLHTDIGDCTRGWIVSTQLSTPSDIHHFILTQKFNQLKGRNICHPPTK